MRRYAQHTTVPQSQSRMEIERVVTRYGASHFGTMSAPDTATVYFRLKSREIQWEIPMPDAKSQAWRSEAKRDQEIRRRWRVMLVTVKALLEAVESGLMTFDEAFLAHIAIPGTARTVGQLVIPKLNGPELPALLARNPE